MNQVSTKTDPSSTKIWNLLAAQRTSIIKHSQILPYWFKWLKALLSVVEAIVYHFWSVVWELINGMLIARTNSDARFDDFEIPWTDSK